MYAFAGETGVDALANFIGSSGRPKASTFKRLSAKHTEACHDERGVITLQHLKADEPERAHVVSKVLYIRGGFADGLLIKRFCKERFCCEELPCAKHPQAGVEIRLGVALCLGVRRGSLKQEENVWVRMYGSGVASLFNVAEPSEVTPKVADESQEALRAKEGGLYVLSLKKKEAWGYEVISMTPAGGFEQSMWEKYVAEETGSCSTDDQYATRRAEIQTAKAQRELLKAKLAEFQHAAMTVYRQDPQEGKKLLKWLHANQQVTHQQVSDKLDQIYEDYDFAPEPSPTKKPKAIDGTPDKVTPSSAGSQ